MVETIATAQTCLTNISWSPDSASPHVVYVENRQDIVVQQIGGKRKVVAQGQEPSWLGKDKIVFVKDHEIWSVSRSGDGETKLFDRKDGFADTNKGAPVGSPDGQRVLFVIRDVHKSKTRWVPDRAYPVRNFYGIGTVSDKSAEAINSSAFGGKLSWFPDGESFAHHEFDATGGARLYITDLKGNNKHIFRGYYPQITSDGKRVLAVDHAFKNVQVISLPEGEIQSLAIPADLAEGRFSNPAFWIGDERVMLEAKGVILDFDLSNKGAVTRRVKIPVARRGLPTMAVSPDQRHVAYERLVDGQSELVLVELKDWLKETLPEPKPEEESAESDAAAETDGDASADSGTDSEQANDES